MYVGSGTLRRLIPVDGARRRYMAIPANTYTTLLPPAYAAGARIHTNSWGSSTNAYTDTCQEMDQFVYENDDMLILAAAGNSGTNGLNTVLSPASAKSKCVAGRSPSPLSCIASNRSRSS